MHFRVLLSVKFAFLVSLRHSLFEIENDASISYAIVNVSARGHLVYRIDDIFDVIKTRLTNQNFWTFYFFSIKTISVQSVIRNNK